MKFASVRLVAENIDEMVAFYELVTGCTADWLAPVFAEIVTPGAVLALGSVETVALFKEGSALPRTNKTAILEFMVADVDAEFERLKNRVEVVHIPKDLPWGNRTMQIADPEGTNVALYTPVTVEARRRFINR
ncbi:VOC family protein [Rhizobium sp. CNPSo 3968]|uniref:VOC family protein n=1 Tax=Rhizobium sp. CNPSo 3968 TaxID=3021408 RepID=UPI00254B5BDB|nr:VOC family protein [Rhizobium sp. CNPSo 3968]MDK4717918.1 VOC family protein [Rhizobium sp. CNPSo 3968]